MLHVKVERSKWLRGEGGFRSYLLRERDRKMCCLGFVGLEVGWPEASLLDSPTPGYVVGFMAAGLGLEGFLREYAPPEGITDDEACDLMTLNDLRVGEVVLRVTGSSVVVTSEEEREKLLIAAGERVGIAFEFVP